MASPTNPPQPPLGATPEPSKTPRTDAAIYEEDTGYNGMVKVVSPDFARTLETELSTARAALSQCEERVKAEAKPYGDSPEGHEENMIADEARDAMRNLPLVERPTPNAHGVSDYAIDNPCSDDFK